MPASKACYRQLWRIPSVSFNDAVIRRKGDDVVFGNKWRERMGVNVLYSATLVGNMYYSASARVIIRLPHSGDDEARKSPVCTDGNCRSTFENRAYASTILTGITSRTLTPIVRPAMLTFFIAGLLYLLCF